MPTIAEIQQKLRDKATTAPARVRAPDKPEPNYALFTTEKLQQIYSKIEDWCLLNKGHEKFAAGKIRLDKINKIIAMRIKI